MLNQLNRLKKNQEFQRVYQHKKSFVGRYLVLYLKKNNLNYTRFGFVVSKKIGKAVERNKIKRRMKEVCRLSFDSFAAGYDLIFVARRKIKGISYQLVEQEIEKLSTRAGILKNE
ncbi:MAG: ribonuclease P protein component [Bacillota bacterium]